MTWLQLRDFRNLEEIELRPHPGGLTVVVGDNGSGKTSLLEGIGYAATQRSLRGAGRDALIRVGAVTAIVRAEVVRHGRQNLIEMELSASGPDHAMLNRHRLTRSEDLSDALLTTVFSPDDLVLVKGPPKARRDYIDDVLAGCSSKTAVLRRRVERVLKQRATLLRQAKGRLTAEIASTLDVWDSQLSEVGESLVTAREEAVSQLAPVADEAWRHLTRTSHQLRLEYRRSWRGDLAGALAEARRDDLRRGVSTRGPHRDDLDIVTGDLDARTRLSQGRQRCVTLALRLAAHETVTRARDARPVLLLDDAFSELDPSTSSALIECLPAGQAVLTTAGEVPSGASVSETVRLVDGTIT